MIGVAPAGMRRRPFFGYNDDPTAFYNGYPFFTSGAAKARNGGANIARFPVDWGYIESTQGQFIWTHIDNAVAACEAASISYMFAVVNAPAWAGSGAETILYPQGATELGHWQTFISTLKARFPRAIFQCWNEPNLTDFGGASAADMAAIVDAFAEVLSDRTIIAPGMSPTTGFDTYQATMHAAITAQNVEPALHAYFGNATGVTNNQNHQARVKWQANRLRAYGDNVWITEGGVDNRHRYDAATIGLARFGLYVALAREPWIKSVIFHRLRQTTDAPGTFEYDGDWGVMDNNLIAKESYTTIKLFRQLGL